MSFLKGKRMAIFLLWLSLIAGFHVGRCMSMYTFALVYFRLSPIERGYNDIHLEEFIGLLNKNANEILSTMKESVDNDPSLTLGNISDVSFQRTGNTVRHPSDVPALQLFWDGDATFVQELVMSSDEVDVGGMEHDVSEQTSFENNVMYASWAAPYFSNNLFALALKETSVFSSVTEINYRTAYTPTTMVPRNPLIVTRDVFLEFVSMAEEFTFSDATIVVRSLEAFWRDVAFDGYVREAIEAVLPGSLVFGYKTTPVNPSLFAAGGSVVGNTMKSQIVTNTSSVIATFYFDCLVYRWVSTTQDDTTQMDDYRTAVDMALEKAFQEKGDVFVTLVKEVASRSNKAEKFQFVSAVEVVPSLPPSINNNDNNQLSGPFPRPHPPPPPSPSFASVPTPQPSSGTRNLVDKSSGAFLFAFIVIFLSFSDSIKCHFR